MIGTYIFAGAVMFSLLYILIAGGVRSRQEVVVLLLIVLFLVLLYWVVSMTTGISIGEPVMAFPDSS